MGVEMEEYAMITDVFLLKDVFSAVFAIVDDCKLLFSEKGLRIATIDPANVVLIEIEIPGWSFKGYNITDSYIIEIELGEILEVVEKKEGYKPVGIYIETMDDGKSNKNEENNNRRYEIKFEIDNIIYGFISTNSKYKNRNSSHFMKDCTEVKINLERFQELMKSCRKVSDYVLFESKDGKIRIYSENDNRNVEMFVDCDIHKKIYSIFSTEYLNDMANAINVANNSVISLYLGYNWPMTIKFNVGTYGSGTYNIAPRVDQELEGGDTRYRISDIVGK